MAATHSTPVPEVGSNRHPSQPPRICRSVECSGPAADAHFDRPLEPEIRTHPRAALSQSLLVHRSPETDAAASASRNALHGESVRFRLRKFPPGLVRKKQWYKPQAPSAVGSGVSWRRPQKHSPEIAATALS